MKHDAPTTPVSATRPTATKRLLRGYGPLLGFGALFLAIAILVPTVQKEIVTETVAADGASSSAGADNTAEGGAGAATEAAAAGDVAAAPANQEACGDRDEQVPGDPYSPPCFAFSGDNAGATAKGVTKDTIKVSARMLDGPGFQDALSDAAGASISDSTADVKRTIEALAEYFNGAYQLYGRKIEVEFHDGKGDALTEILGGGQEAAEADAIKVAEEIGAFAEINGISPPFADALARRDVINFGAPYMSKEWFDKRRPFVWSPLTDSTIVVETINEYYGKRLGGGRAIHARGDLEGKERKLGVIAPENSWYQEAVASGRKVLGEYGFAPALDEKYKLDLSLMSNQATNLVAKLKNAGITTVLCGCDPVLMVFLTGKAQEQNYHPEWLITGVAFVDIDLVGQLFQQDQWSRAFGISFAGETQPQRASLGYNAYKTVRDDEPAFAVDLIYYQMQMLAIGVQMAGPELTPETFEAGMFAYPDRTGPGGTWGFGPSNYTTTQDAREIWFNADARSVQNNEVGAYVDANAGKRFKIGEWPGGEPQVGG